jgi:hypothetical protein
MPGTSSRRSTVVDAVIQNADGSQEPITVTIQGQAPPAGTELLAQVERVSGAIEDVSVMIVDDEESDSDMNQTPTSPRIPPVRFQGIERIPIQRRMTLLRRVLDDEFPPPLDNNYSQFADPQLGSAQMPSDFDELLDVDALDDLFGPGNTGGPSIPDLLTAPVQDPQQLIDIMPETLQPQPQNVRRTRLRLPRRVDDFFNDDFQTAPESVFDQPPLVPQNANLMSLDSVVNMVAQSPTGLVLLADILENQPAEQVPAAIQNLVDFDYVQFDREHCGGQANSREDSWADFANDDDREVSRFFR